jgi:D-arabinose 1-dehydrogenase-like Zn-dependent alcohol dehydrogenase
MAKHAGTFDFILDAVSAQHDIDSYMALLVPEGNLTLLGAPAWSFLVSALEGSSGTMPNQSLASSSVTSSL